MTSPLAILRRSRRKPFVLFGWFALVVVTLFQVCFTPEAAASAASTSMSAMAADCGSVGMPHGQQLPACCLPGHVQICTGQSIATNARQTLASHSILANLAVSTALLPRRIIPLSSALSAYRTPPLLPLYLRYGRFLI